MYEYFYQRWLCITGTYQNCFLRYPDPEDRIFSRVFADISVIAGKTTLTISSFIETGTQVEYEIVRVVSLGTRKKNEITRLKKKKRSSGSEYFNNPAEFCDDSEEGVILNTLWEKEKMLVNSIFSFFLDVFLYFTDYFDDWITSTKY